MKTILSEQQLFGPQALCVAVGAAKVFIKALPVRM